MSTTLPKLKAGIRAYKDLDYNFLLHPVTSDVSTKDDIAAIQQAIRTLLLTKRHERLFRPEMGSIIKDLLFDQIDVFIIDAIKNEIQDIITSYEPRVSLTNVSITQDPSDDWNILIDIEFKIKGIERIYSVSTILERTR
jgi:phage baseplate assembly protein W